MTPSAHLASVQQRWLVQRKWKVSLQCSGAGVCLCHLEREVTYLVNKDNKIDHSRNLYIKVQQMCSLKLNWILEVDSIYISSKSVDHYCK